MNLYLLGGIAVFILTVVVSVIAQRLTPHYDYCPGCFIIMAATLWLLYMLYAYHNHLYFDISESFFMLVIIFALGLAVLYGTYRQRSLAPH